MSVTVRPLPSADPLSEASLARELQTRHLVFDAHVHGKRRVDLHPLVLSADMHRRAYDTAARVAALVSRASSWAQEVDEAAKYGLPPDAVTLATSSYEAKDRSRLWRVDLLLGADDNFYACEVNADCPGGLNEAVALPRLARAAGLRGAVSDPTRVVAGLASRLEALSKRRGGGTVAILYATGYAEDLQVCALVDRELEQRGVRSILCPPTAPIAWGDDLWVGEERIRALYRFYPIEAMEGQQNIADIAWAVRTGRVRTMSSFACAYAQSKVALARAWSRPNDLGDLRAALEHIPETRSEIDLSAPRENWVLKKGLGRVGEDVLVGALMTDSDWKEAVQWTRAETEGGTPWIAQRFVPQRPIDTPWGPRLLTLGVYVLDGSPIGYFGRLSVVSLATHDALCVPVMVEETRVAA